MTTKPWWASRTLYVNVLSILVVAIGGVLDMAGVLELTAQQVAIVTIALAVTNAALRVFATNQPLSIGGRVPSLSLRKARPR